MKKIGTYNLDFVPAFVHMFLIQTLSTQECQKNLVVGLKKNQAAHEHLEAQLVRVRLDSTRLVTKAELELNFRLVHEPNSGMMSSAHLCTLGLFIKARLVK